MGARTSKQVIQKLKEQPMEIWHQGQRVSDVTAEPGFANGVKSLAALYDLQWQEPDTLLFDSPDTGDKVGLTFMIPRTKAELSRIGNGMQLTAGVV